MARRARVTPFITVLIYEVLIRDMKRRINDKNGSGKVGFFYVFLLGLDVLSSSIQKVLIYRDVTQ